jgi:hypothetical protein
MGRVQERILFPYVRVAMLYDLHSWISIHQYTILIQLPCVEHLEGLSMPSDTHASYSISLRNEHG